ncbi:hypothetical protein GF314_15875 [bacterium]|nr:hypothetical protein [bacterium]
MTSSRMLPRHVRMLVATLASLLVLGGAAVAQSPATGNGGDEDEIYRIGPGDVLRLNVPQLPDLDGELTVQSDGRIYVQQVGEVTVANLTLEEAEQLISRRLQLFDPSVTSVVLGVVEFNALRVFALGAVSEPGAHNFETPPTLWEVLRAAGGPAENANLASCRVITVVDGRPQSRIVDLSGYLTGTGLPDDVLRSGDTLVVPLVADGSVGVPSSQGVQVFGSVATPTTVPIQGPMDLVSVLMLSGAPMTDAKLSEVDWVHRERESGRTISRRIDLRKFLQEGKASGNPIVHPGDVVYVPQERPGWLQEYLPLFLTVITSATTLWLAYDRITEE